MLQPGLRRAFVLVVGMSLSACGTVSGVFYNETRDKQAQTAQAAWAKVDSAALFTAARKNQAAMQTELLRLIDERATVDRDYNLYVLATSEEPLQDVLFDPAKTRLDDVLGSRPETPLLELARNWDNYLLKRRKAQADLLTVADRFLADGLEMPACAKDASQITTFAYPAFMALFQSACTTLNSQPVDGSKQPLDTQGFLGAARNSLKIARENLVDAREKSLAQRNEARLAIKAYDDAKAALKPDSGGKANEKVKDLATKLKTALSVLKGLDDVFSVQFVSEQDALAANKLTTALLETPDGQIAAPSASHPASALMILQSLASSSEETWAATQSPTLTSLLLKKNLAQARQQAALNDIAEQQRIVALYEQRVDALSARSVNLYQALNLMRTGAPVLDMARLETGRTLQVTSVKQLRPGEKLLPLSARQNVQQAAGRYLDDIGRLAPAAERPLYQIHAAAHSRAIGYAEADIALWSTVITTSTTQLAEYGAAGVKTEDILRLLNSATLLWIGKGVN